LKRQKDWLVWSRSLTNYLSTILGQDGVPLSYIICENDEPNYDNEDKEDFDFEQLSIKCAPLVRVFYKTDVRKVHQLIHGFVHGETAETWIKPKEKPPNGWLDFKALQAHYGGKGNKSVRIKEAGVLRNSLHDKNERAMSFEMFITNMQAMFTGFEDNDELLTDAQKIRLLFQKVQSPSLTQVKNALQVSYDLDKAGEVTYNFLANSMAAEAASLPDHAHNRQASGLDRHPTPGSAPASGIKGANGDIFTGFYKNFQSLSDDEKQAIFDERKRLNINPKKNRGNHSRKGQTSAIKVNKKTLSKMTREISSMKARLKDIKATKVTFKDEDSNVQDNAGDQFGGRKKKKKQKKSNQQDGLIGHLSTLPNYILNCIWFILYQCSEWCEKTANTNDVRLLAPLQTTGQRNTSGFRAGKRKISENQQSSAARSRWIHMPTPSYAVPIA
jgi:hypothetical protein